jgi:hypothetical protein
VGRRTLAITISGILLAAALGFQPARAQTEQNAQAAGKARASVQKLGLGRNARVEVKLRDNTKLKGYISAAEQDSFTVTDSKTGDAKTVAYADVSNVKKSGGGLSTRTWLIIGGAAVAAVVVGIIVKPAVCNGGAQTRFPC